MNEFQLAGLMTLPISFIMMTAGVYSNSNENSTIGMLGGGMLFLLSLVMLFVGYVVLEV